jgi:hypothetical protein
LRGGNGRYSPPEALAITRQQECAARVKSALTAVGLPIMLSETHIVPVMVGDPEKYKRASDLLLYENGIYLQPINYPTVPRGTERLRITATPYHDDVLIDQLAEALTDVWRRVALTTWFPGDFRTVEGVLKDVQENRKVGSVLLGPNVPDIRV